MQISGGGARDWCAVRLDSMEQVNKGELTSADDESGKVEWRDKTGNARSITLGPHAIRLTRSYRYGR
jgi:hypothetical protein